MKVVLGRKSSEKTIHKYVRQLVDDGELEEHPVTIGYSRYKYLYISTKDETKTIDRKLDEIRGKINILMKMISQSKGK